MSASSGLMAIGHILLCYILFLSFNKPFGYGAIVVEKNKSHSPPPGPPLCSGKGLRGPCSPFGQKKPATTSNQTLAKDERRVQVMNSGSYNMRKATGEGGSEYPDFLVRVGFGTPVQYFDLSLDTGSYVTWVRCQRCTGSPCEQQQYDPSSSSTSSNAPCWTTPLSCNYNQGYLDESHADGFFMVDTLFIGKEYEIPDFVLLCATDDTGDFGKADGILGLGMAGGGEFGSYSLTYQTTTMFDNVFCYCFPTSDNSMGYVYFGEEARQNCRNSGSYTPLVENPSDHPSEYFVNLMAITIGQKRIEISSSYSSSPGTFIDSGTVITMLPSYVYSALRFEFRGFMAEYPRADPDEVLDTCYDLSGYDVPAIPMVLHFENLDVPLDQTGVVSKVDGMSRVCLAFAAKQDESNPTIIGSQQQQKLVILFNVPYQRVEIGPGNC